MTTNFTKYTMTFILDTKGSTPTSTMRETIRPLGRQWRREKDHEKLIIEEIKVIEFRIENTSMTWWICLWKRETNWGKNARTRMKTENALAWLSKVLSIALWMENTSGRGKMLCWRRWSPWKRRNPHVLWTWRRLTSAIEIIWISVCWWRRDN